MSNYCLCHLDELCLYCGYKCGDVLVSLDSDATYYVVDVYPTHVVCRNKGKKYFKFNDMIRFRKVVKWC